jgi:hypothetical protein
VGRGEKLLIVVFWLFCVACDVSMMWVFWELVRVLELRRAVVCEVCADKFE